MNLFQSVLAPDTLFRLASRIEETYRKTERTRRTTPLSIPDLPPREKFTATASSFTISAILSEKDVHSILSALDESQVGPRLRRECGGAVVCNLDHCWVRRQYAPDRYPPLHAPHGWHQDGALGFDFRSYSHGCYPADALLPMVTCWIALDPCGLEAPGLELMTNNLPQLLQPSDLADSHIRDRFPAESFWRPAMQPGDALVFPGDILHRTHVTPAMTRDRTSIELRFFAAENLPARLKGDRFRAIESEHLT